MALLVALMRLALKVKMLKFRTHQNLRLKESAITPRPSLILCRFVPYFGQRFPYT